MFGFSGPVLALGDADAVSLPIEPPSVVGTQQGAVSLDPTFGKRCESVGAGIVKTPPLAGTVAPQDDIFAEELDGVGTGGVEEV